MTGTDQAGNGQADISALLQIDLDAIVANWRILGGHHPSGPAAAVLKADGYGLGAAAIGAALHAAGCRHFFVAQPIEAAALRPAIADAMLCVLAAPPPGGEPDFLALDAWPALGSLDEVARWVAFGRVVGRPLPALLHVDTGLARTGLSAADCARVRADPDCLDGIDWRFVMTHLVSAEAAEDPVNAAQRARFAGLSWLLPAVPRSFANSSGIFLGAGFGSTLARPGAALYGVNPTPGRPNPMRPVARLSAPVLQLRVIGAGETVGYNGTWTAARPSRIATIGVGYADGWPRRLSGRGAAAFDGQSLPLVGRVSMDLTTYDATDAPAVGPGSRLTLLGPERPLAAVAAEAGTNEYEILTSLGRRYARRFGPL